MDTIIKAIVFLPLIGFLIAGLFGSSIGAKASEYVTSGLMIIAAALSWYVFFDVALGHQEMIKVSVLRWIQSGSFDVEWAFRVDTLTSVMFVVVNTVSTLVHVYSIGYMHHDPHRPRFFAYLSLFTFAMLMLITSDNLVQMFFGWEGVGLASYLLIGFWYKKPSANAAAMKAFIVNRVGDFGFSLGIFLVFVLFGSVNFETIFAAAQTYLPAEGAATGRRLSPCSVCTSIRLTRSPLPACCSSWARWASRRSSCCTPGFRTRWKARPRFRLLSMPQPWSPPASSSSPACRRSSNCRRTH